ncbi:MAG: hypothetical protein R2734_04845 [Nocardioides sp.]
MGRPDKRWWDGHRWSELVQGEIPGSDVLTMSHSLAGSTRVRPWWQSWRVIVPTMLVTGIGYIILWTRDSTPVSIKVLATLMFPVCLFVMAVLFFGLTGQLGP